VPLPANTYKGQTAAVDTLAVMAVWTTHDGVPDNVAYEVTKALYENTAIMGQVHVQGKNISWPRPPRWAPRRCTPVRCVLQGKGHRQVKPARRAAALGGVPRCCWHGPLGLRAGADRAPQRRASWRGCRWTRPRAGTAHRFEHSVLGTPVEDRYRFTPRGWRALVEERFDGEGYGLPHAAGPGERCSATAPAGGC
jgi:hypothetical protein